MQRRLAILDKGLVGWNESRNHWLYLVVYYGW